MNLLKIVMSFFLALSLTLVVGCSQANTEAETSVTQKKALGTCLEVSLTGTMGGPSIFNGLAGSGTLVRYGRVENNCGDIHLQFDAGRATSLRLSELGVGVNKLDAIFITHLHSDHSVGLVDILQTRWHFSGEPVDLVCSEDAAAHKPEPRTLSCANYGQHIADAAIKAGEIAQRSAENKKRDESGPASIVNYIPVVAKPASIDKSAQPVQVWQSGDVTVSAINSKHIPGHLSYRVDTPQGSVVIGGDAGNDKVSLPRDNSTSAAVELLAEGADILVHSTVHPVFGPGGGSDFPIPVFSRQSTAGDLGAMAKRANVDQLMLTHLIPPLGAKSVGPYKVPGGALTEEDYINAVKESGYDGNLHIGVDLLTVRLPISK